jgi:glycolate oxidase iron-sulfur subunit
VRAEPRAILERVTGLARVELPDSEACCGSAGIYSLLRPAASRAVFAKKLADLERSGARTVITANPGCQLQWESGLRRAGSGVLVLHLAELVDAALSAGAPRPRGEGTRPPASQESTIAIDPSSSTRRSSSTGL